MFYISVQINTKSDSGENLNDLNGVIKMSLSCVREHYLHKPKEKQNNVSLDLAVCIFNLS